MKKIGDISKHQPTSLINWPVFGKQFDLLFLRVQYGSSGPDKEYANHAANCVAHGVPFYSYAFPRFTSVADAVTEATDANKRQHTKSLGMVLDIEFEMDSKGNPTGIAKLSKAARLDAIKAFVAQLRKLGVKRVGAYVGHNIYESWGIASVAGLFDFVWIPRYGENKPKYPCHIWQHTETGRVDGYNGNIDLNTLVGDKNLEWFIGSAPKVASATTAKPSGLLRKGDKGAAVKDLQTKLNKAGFNCGTPDGVFGDKTEGALRKFQASKNLTVDGIYGPTTKAKIEAALSYTLPNGVIHKGDKGTAVKQLQTALNAAGFKCGTADGAFGANTESAVKKFQAKYGLGSDGIYGPKTKAKLAEVLK
jgi:N-acetylmuramoyl-L-alanine amidase